MSDVIFWRPKQSKEGTVIDKQRMSHEGQLWAGDKDNICKTRPLAIVTAVAHQKYQLRANARLTEAFV